MNKFWQVVFRLLVLVAVVSFVTGGFGWIGYLWYSVTTDSIIGIVGRTIVAGLIIGMVLGYLRK